MSTPSASLRPYVRQATEHQRLAYTGGAQLAVILDAAITGGQLTVIESHSRRGDASPVHVHGRDDEAFLLLDGEMTVWVGEAVHPGGIQETVFRSAGWDLSRPMPGGWQVKLSRHRPALALARGHRRARQWR